MFLSVLTAVLAATSALAHPVQCPARGVRASGGPWDLVAFDMSAPADSRGTPLTIGPPVSTDPNVRTFTTRPWNSSPPEYTPLDLQNGSLVGTQLHGTAQPVFAGSPVTFKFGSTDPVEIYCASVGLPPTTPTLSVFGGIYDFALCKDTDGHETLYYKPQPSTPNYNTCLVVKIMLLPPTWTTGGEHHDPEPQDWRSDVREKICSKA